MIFRDALAATAAAPDKCARSMCTSAASPSAKDAIWSSDAPDHVDLLPDERRHSSQLQAERVEGIVDPASAMIPRSRVNRVARHLLTLGLAAGAAAVFGCGGGGTAGPRDGGDIGDTRDGSSGIGRAPDPGGAPGLGGTSGSSGSPALGGASGSGGVPVPGGMLAWDAAIPSSGGVWTPTGSLAAARAFHTATLLGNGEVLVAGGLFADGVVEPSYLASAELYDPAAGTWTATGSLATARSDHTATLLGNGNVLVTGGQLLMTIGPSTAAVPLGSAELFDLATGKWTATGALATARVQHTATVLGNGKVLVVGGYSASFLASAEVYDPATGTWTATGALATARAYHIASLLQNGKVLVAGGLGKDGSLASAEVYDPVTGTWTATGALATARNSFGATLLENGKVLVVGGNSRVGAGTVALKSAELYEPTMGTWMATGPLATWRTGRTSTLLGNGKVLVAGGSDGADSLASAELFDPATGTWMATSSLATPRRAHTTTLLSNGDLLVVGGKNNARNLSSAELYRR